MSGKAYTDEELANLTDDEIMAIDIFPSGVSEEDPVVTTEEPIEAAAVVEAEEEDDPVGSNAADLDDDTPAVSADGDAGEGVSAPSETPTTAPAAKANVAAPVDGVAKTEEPVKVEEPQGSAAVDLKGFYDKIMAPFKANGKEVKLQSPDEVVRLMQMGANYTKKLQALQPSLKLLKMLENNGLLDEGKLTYLIDLDKKNPQAIQKFIKESGVDPLEIDTAAEPAYTPGNHKVSDAEMALQSTLDELMLDPAGQNTVVAVNKTWDAESKKVLLKEPGVLQAIHEQRQSGIYDKISAEVDRRKMLGLISPSQPFVHTYLAVGKEMDSQGLLATKPAAATQPSRIVDTRAAIRPKTVVNDAAARAASPVNSAPKKATPDFNPLAMSDEDFEKSAALASRL